MSTGAEPDVAEALRKSISRFVRSVRQRADTLPPGRAEILRHLRTDGPQTMAALATTRGVSHQSVSRTIGELERLELTRRRPNPADGRAFLIELTPTGRRVLADDEDARRRLIASTIDEVLDDEERKVLQQVPALLDRISAALAVAP
jgi:DNA-binding MarR family transcriptional regulator